MDRGGQQGLQGAQMQQDQRKTEGEQRLKSQELRQTDEHNRRTSDIAGYQAVTGAQQKARDSERE